MFFKCLLWHSRYLRAAEIASKGLEGDLANTCTLFETAAYRYMSWPFSVGRWGLLKLAIRHFANLEQNLGKSQLNFETAFLAVIVTAADGAKETAAKLCHETNMRFVETPDKVTAEAAALQEIAYLHQTQNPDATPSLYDPKLDKMNTCLQQIESGRRAVIMLEFAKLSKQLAKRPAIERKEVLEWRLIAKEYSKQAKDTARDQFLCEVGN